MNELKIHRGLPQLTYKLSKQLSKYVKTFEITHSHRPTSQQDFYAVVKVLSVAGAVSKEDVATAISIEISSPFEHEYSLLYICLYKKVLNKYIRHHEENYFRIHEPLTDVLRRVADSDLKKFGRQT